MAETRTRDSKLIRLTEVPKNGKPIGRSKVIWAGVHRIIAHLDSPESSPESHYPEFQESLLKEKEDGANAYLLGEGVHLPNAGGYFLCKAVQYYKIPENPEKE